MEGAPVILFYSRGMYISIPFNSFYMIYSVQLCFRCKDEDFDGGLCMYGLNTGGLRDCWRCRCYTRDEPIKKPIIYGF